MKPFTRLALTILWLIGLFAAHPLHSRWQVTLNGAPVPLWVS
jgi:hypothetical protein